MAKVVSVKMVTQIDECPELSFLGEYSNKPDPKGHIDRKERGDMGRNEFRYFNLGCGDSDYIEQAYQRMEAYNRGEWYMIGVKAVAEVEYTSGIRDTIESPGLWGIESDSSGNYLKEVYADELKVLEAMLAELGLELPKEVESVQE